MHFQLFKGWTNDKVVIDKQVLGKICGWHEFCTCFPVFSVLQPFLICTTGIITFRLEGDMCKYKTILIKEHPNFSPHTFSVSHQLNYVYDMIWARSSHIFFIFVAFLIWNHLSPCFAWQMWDKWMLWLMTHLVIHIWWKNLGECHVSDQYEQ